MAGDQALAGAGADGWIRGSSASTMGAARSSAAASPATASVDGPAGAPPLQLAAFTTG
jgi:hypothetical protein